MRRASSRVVGSEMRCLRLWATCMRSMASAGLTVPSCFPRALAAARDALARSEIPPRRFRRDDSKPLAAFEALPSSRQLAAALPTL
jgi:hypothetical protein